MAGEYDFGRMQEDAVRRAREMQSRARVPQPARSRPSSSHSEHAAREEHAQETVHNREAVEEPVPSPVSEPEAPAASEAVLEDSSSAGILETLFKDKERTIILALLILLGAEGGNHELMFALMFLLM